MVVLQEAFVPAAHAGALAASVRHFLLLPRQIVAIAQGVGLRDVVDDGRQQLAVVVHVEVLGAEKLDAVCPDGHEPVADDPCGSLVSPLSKTLEAGVRNLLAQLPVDIPQVERPEDGLLLGRQLFQDVGFRARLAV